MNRFAIFLAVGATAVAAPGQARADNGLPTPPGFVDPDQALSPVTMVSGSGIKVGEGTVFTPQVGLETGVVSNVFYTDTNATAAGLLRLLIEVGTGSLPQSRFDTSRGAVTPGADPTNPNADPDLTGSASTASRGDFQYSANVYASWDQYLSTNHDVNAQGGLGGGLLLRGLVNPQQPLQFAFLEDFNRLIRATNFESNEDTNRDINTLGLRLNYQPYGRSLGGYLYYSNLIDVFEAGNQQFANRMQNTLGLRVNWNWLPLTRVYGDVSMGYYTGLGSSDKINSYPLLATLGIQTALTLNTTLGAHVGYANGFYASGPSYSGLDGGVMAGYRYSPLGRITAQYAYQHSDSINANFYTDHVIQARIEQYFIPFVVFAQPELRFRHYDGTIVMGTDGTNTRDDTIFSGTLGMRYSFRDWLAGTLDYRIDDVETDFRYDAGGGLVVNPSYVRHELLLGVRAAY